VNQSRNEVVGSVTVPCMCGRGADKLLFLAEDQISWNPGLFRVVACTNCGLVRTSPRPSEAELGGYYPEDYEPYVEATRGPIRKLIKRLVPSSRDSEIPVVDKPGAALELGCSHGAFLDKLVGDGWSVTGVEYSEKASQAARDRGHLVLAGRVEDMNFDNSSFDLIVAWMVVEHLSDPVLALTKASQWASPNGRLALSVPNIDSTSFRLFGRHWFNLQVPTHFHHFSPKTIEELLDRSGWRVDKISHQVTFRTFVESFRLKILRRKVPEPLNKVWSTVSNVATIAGLPIAVYLARKQKADRMTVWASKK
jgi:2-polyprenyl-3-methyl-5-hydroxy-6-metoxy-1,4-benzoquinol methylase